MRYNYCLVMIEDFSRDFFYIYDGDDDIKKGDRVLVPFGRENNILSGIVTSSDFYTLEDLPFPLERTKKIISVIRPGKELSDFEETIIFGKDFEKLEKYIENENYDLIFKWAYDHEKFTDSRAVKKKAAKCYSLCADQNMPEAFLHLGNLYYDGRGVRKSFKKAFELYSTAASFSIQDAFSCLGDCYYYGRGVRKNYKKAYENFSLGVLLYDDGKCLYMIGDMFRDGNFLEKNGLNAFKLYRRAYLEIPEKSILGCEILVRLGRCYLEGIGVKEDLEEAYNYFSMALNGFYAFRHSFYLNLNSVKECRIYMGITQEKMGMEVLKERD